MTLPCPICAYDLSAHPSAWLTACPLASPCPECGETLHWRELLNPDRRPHPTNFEYGRVHVFRRYLLTSLATLYPPALWQTVRPDQIPRFPRLLFLAASWTVVVHALITAAVYFLSRRHLVLPSAAGQYVPWWPWNMDISIPAGPPSTNMSLLVPLAVPGVLYLVPILTTFLLLFPATLFVPALRTRDILRAWLYSIPPATILLIPQILVMTVPFIVEARLSAGPFGNRLPLTWMLYLSALSWHAVAMTAWWRSCFRRYLRLPRPGPAAMFLLIGMIALPILTLVILSLL